MENEDRLSGVRRLDPVIDGLGWKRWTFPLVVVSSNSIVNYLIATVFSVVPPIIADVIIGGLGRDAGGNQGMLLSIASGAITWLFLLLLYGAKLFVRVGMSCQ